MLVAETFDIDVNGGEFGIKKLTLNRGEFGIILWGRSIAGKYYTREKFNIMLRRCST